MMVWTEERVSAARALWNEGKSASQVAATLGGGTTKNAVMGKLFRMGLVGHRKLDRVGWNGRPVHRSPPSAPRSFSWEQRA